MTVIKLHEDKQIIFACVKCSNDVFIISPYTSEQLGVKENWFGLVKIVCVNCDKEQLLFIDFDYKSYFLDDEDEDDNEFEKGLDN